MRVKELRAKKGEKRKHDVWGSYIVLVEPTSQRLAIAKRLIRDCEKVTENEINEIERQVEVTVNESLHKV